METSLTNELIREVYPIDMDKDCYVDIHKETGKVMWFGKELNDYRSEIDKHNVANKCKQWASTHNYSVMSGWEMTHWGGAYRVDVYRNFNNILFSMSTVETEPDAIFKACEWIRKKLKG